jgi:hypothetical protein
MPKWHVEDSPYDRILRGNVAQSPDAIGQPPVPAPLVQPELDRASAHLADRLSRFQQTRLVSELVRRTERLRAHGIVVGIWS